MHKTHSQKQAEFLFSFGINPLELTTGQIFKTILWLKYQNPTKEQVDKLKARINLLNPTKAAASGGSGDEPL